MSNEEQIPMVASGQFNSFDDFPMGMRYLAMGTSELPSNCPNGVWGYGILSTLVVSSDNARQEYNDLNEKTYIRIKASGKWGTWQPIIAGKIDNQRKINGTVFDATENIRLYRVPESDIDVNPGLKHFDADKAIYKPSETVNFTVTPKSNAGNLEIEYYRRNELIRKQSVAYDSQFAAWYWELPDVDNESYIVKVNNIVRGSNEISYMAINVASDPKERPIMGFLSKYDKFDINKMKENLSFLRRLHINYIQYYDWFDRHEVPMVSSDEGFVSHYWTDFAKRPTRFDVLQKYTELGNQYGMLNMAYGLINGASQNEELNGTTKEMYMFDSSSKDLKDVTNTDLRPWAKNVLYQMNYMNEAYQDFASNQMAKIYKYLPFDGWHIDTLGDPGNKYSANGDLIDSSLWKIAYPYFINKAIVNSGGKRAGINSVAEYGQKEASNSDADYIYTEVWDNRKTYNDLFNMINEMRVMSNKELIVAGYMHHHWSNQDSNFPSDFNDPAVILTNMVIMGSGATHLEMGEHMLTTEYFPNSKLSLSLFLKDYIVKMYDFSVAFKRLFTMRDKATSLLTSSTHNLSNNEMKQNTVSVISKEDNWYRMDFLINMVNLNGDTWRDDEKNRNTPDIQKDIKVSFSAIHDTSYKHFYIVDTDNLVPREVLIDNDGYITIPELKYSTMIYATKF